MERFPELKEGHVHLQGFQATLFLQQTIPGSPASHFLPFERPLTGSQMAIPM